MDTVGVAMYNAAHMLAQSIRSAGTLGLEGVREALEGMAFPEAPKAVCGCDAKITS